MISKERLIRILNNYLETTIEIESGSITIKGDGNIKVDKSEDIKVYIEEIENSKYDSVFKILGN